MLYKYFPPNPTHVTALPVKVRCSKLLHNVEMYYLTTELAYSRLKYGLFSRVISCRGKSAQNSQNACSKSALRTSHAVHGHKQLDDDDASLAPGKKQHCVLDELRRRPVETQKNSRQGRPVHVWQWPLSKKVVVTVCPLHFDTKSKQSVTNPVLGKNLQHPPLTR